MNPTHAATFLAILENGDAFTTADGFVIAIRRESEEVLLLSHDAHANPSISLEDIVTKSFIISGGSYKGMVAILLKETPKGVRVIVSMEERWISNKSAGRTVAPITSHPVPEGSRRSLRIKKINDEKEESRQSDLPKHVIDKVNVACIKAMIESKQRSMDTEGETATVVLQQPVASSAADSEDIAAAVVQLQPVASTNDEEYDDGSDDKSQDGTELDETVPVVHQQPAAFDDMEQDEEEETSDAGGDVFDDVEAPMQEAENEPSLAFGPAPRDGADAEATVAGCPVSLSGNIELEGRGGAFHGSNDIGGNVLDDEVPIQTDIEQKVPSSKARKPKAR